MLFGKNGFVSNDMDNNANDDALIMEAAIMDVMTNEDIEVALENTLDVDMAVNQEIVQERTIVRLDKKAKKSKAEKMAIFTIAREKKDPDFKKLLTVWKLERFLEAKLEKKYASKAKMKAKEALRNATKSKSKMVKTVANKASKMINTK